MKKIVIIVGTMLAVLTLSFQLSEGLPRFAAESEQKCNLCHVNPAGGGIRNSYGSQYFAQTEMAVKKTPFDQLANLQPKVSETITLGMDMRTQYIYDEQSEMSSFFQMEGNAYLSAQLDKKFSLTFSKGLYNGFEIYGMGYVLPYNGNFRVGKFQPAYGWRFADHTSFVREKMLWPANSTDTGFELGFYPHRISANIGVFNGSSSTFDTGKGKAVSVRLEFREHIGFLGFGLGGSVYSNDNYNGTQTMYGPLYYANFFGRKLVYIGELDWLKNDLSDETETISMASTHKLSYSPIQGITLNVLYDHFDPDVDLKSGYISRSGFGITYFPFAFLEFEPVIRFYDDKTVDKEYMLLNSQFHFFF